MMPIQKRRIFPGLALTLLLAVGGSVAGYFAARYLLFRMVEAVLARYALRLTTDGEASSAQARTVLDAANASHLPWCSNTELDYLRQVLIPAGYVKDVGHMQNGRIECSATLGRVRSRGEVLKPDYFQQDGTAVYNEFVPVPDRTLRLVGLQRGNSYIVFGEHRTPPLDPIPMSVTITVASSPGNPGGTLDGKTPPGIGPAFERAGKGVVGDVLYATRCSPHYFYCLSTYVPIPVLLQMSRAKVLAGPLLGGILGALLGLLSLFAYRQSRNMEQQLRRAVRRNALGAAYQPVYDIASGRIVAAEALARWRDEDGYEVSPELFIRVAEERGFCGEITRLMLRRVLHELTTSLKDFPGVRINLNVTGGDLNDPDFLPMLEQHLVSAAVPARRVGIEITESTYACHETSQDAVLELRRRGHLVHIDDFGTGYSSLAYLNELSIDVMKIDKAFTQSIGTESVKVSILPQILSMAEALQLEVIVEGIETEEQAAYFANLERPVLAQGWFYGRAMPIEDFVRVLRQNARREEQDQTKCVPTEVVQVEVP
jgi:sensor c-di-GMP phosphodiesterase-like protein